MVTINAVFRMIVLAKRQGKGKLGNGVILSRLIGTLSNLGDDSAEIQRRLVITPGNIALNRYADKLVQDQVHFPFPNEPYGIPIQHFQSIVLASNSGSAGYSHYLERMYRFCKDVLNTENIPSLLEGLLEQLHADASVQSIFYNRQNTPKSALYGTPAHPRRLCMEALLIGILYHTLMSGATENARGIALPYPQDQHYRQSRYRSLFKVILIRQMRLATPFGLRRITEHVHADSIKQKHQVIQI